MKIEPGIRVGRLLVLERAASPAGTKNSYWLVRCDCGTLKGVQSGNLRVITSCGCYRRELTIARNAKRRSERPPATPRVRRPPSRRRSVPTENSYASMRTRCANPRSASYSLYGARGIRVCERWSAPRGGYRAFLLDMGPRPDGTSLDRIDPNGHYSCGKCDDCRRRGLAPNCRWATRAQQAQNRRNSVLTWDLVNEIRGRVEHGEMQISVAARLGLTPTMINSVVRGRSWAE